MWYEMWRQRWPGGQCDHRHVLSLCVRLCRAPLCLRLHLHKRLQVRERGQFSHPLPGVGFVRQARGQISSASSEDKSWGTHCAPCPLRASFSRLCCGVRGCGARGPSTGQELRPFNQIANALHILTRFVTLQIYSESPVILSKL